MCSNEESRLKILNLDTNRLTCIALYTICFIFALFQNFKRYHRERYLMAAILFSNIIDIYEMYLKRNCGYRSLSSEKLRYPLRFVVNYGQPVIQHFRSRTVQKAPLQSVILKEMVLPTPVISIII